MSHLRSHTHPLETALLRAAARRSLPGPAERRAIRRGAGVRALDVDVSTVTAWERGVRAPQGRLVAPYVAILDRLREASS